jgi:hypothetical protein
MATSTRLLAKGQSSGEQTAAVYIERKEENRLFEEFENSLGLGKENTHKEKPFLFLIDGIGGIGKQALIIVSATQAGRPASSVRCHPCGTGL